MNNYNKCIPEGFQDLLFQDCLMEKKLEYTMRSLFRKYGYYEIETPSFEYYDVFSSEKDIMPTENMFKFYDPKGRILVLKPDMTVPVARVIATKLKDSTYPLRISYIGKTYKFNQAGDERPKESTEAGIELLGAKNPEADAEVVLLAIHSLLSAGFKSFQIDIGQVEFFKELMLEAGLDDEEAESVRVLIEKKDMVGVEEIIQTHKINENLKEIILNLPAFFGTIDVIQKVKNMAPCDRALKSLNYLEKVVEIVKEYGFEEYISIDLGMVHRLNYYTGIIFRGYTHGMGFPILSGGRYDKLIDMFGKECPAVGFSAKINMIMNALSGQKIEFENPVVNMVIGYVEGSRKEALKEAEELRERGAVVECDVIGQSFEELKEYAQKKQIEEVIYFDSNNKVIKYRTDSVK